MYNGKKVSVIIAAAGSARRMGGIDKIFLELDGMPVLAQVVRTFEEDPHIDEIVIAVREDRIAQCRSGIVDRFGFRKVSEIVPGGAERADSVRHALETISPDASIILVQDGARPFSGPDITERVLAAVCDKGAAVPAVPLKDTVKIVETEKGREQVVSTPNRSTLRAVQTPQGFEADLLRRVYGLTGTSGVPDPAGITDDASLVEAAGGTVLIVEGSEDNIKITTAEDVEKAQLILRRRKNAASESRQSPAGYPYPRTGIGFDVHAFAENRKLILGGVEIPYEKGLQGHSDADVLIHAVMDALLGACALRDIGFYFPDTDPALKGADSRELLSRTVQILSDRSWEILSIDAVIMAQKPKLAPHIEQMKKNIADVLNLSAEDVGVKATTTERLGFTGRGEGIAAQAVAVVVKKHSV